MEGTDVKKAEGEKSPGFDPELSPRAQANRDAAAAWGLRFDPRKRSYVDVGGCLVCDRFGQPY